MSAHAVGSLPFPVERLPRRRFWLGSLVTVAAGLFMGAAILGGIAAADTLPTRIALPGFLALLLAVGATTQHLWLTGRRLRQRDAVGVLERDSRPPVLFLRSFGDDDVVDLTSRQRWRQGVRRVEESLCDALDGAGPVVAVGRPGERLPELGAARLYVTDDHWRTAVLHLMRRASWVVIVVGRSEGVWWEIETALAEVAPWRALFFFPYMEDKETRSSFMHLLTPRARILRERVFARMQRDREERYELFRRRVQPLIDADLPERLGDAQFLSFRYGGEPRLVPTVRPPLLESVLQVSFTNARVGIHMERTLAPVLEE